MRIQNFPQGQHFINRILQITGKQKHYTPSPLGWGEVPYFIL